MTELTLDTSKNHSEDFLIYPSETDPPKTMNALTARSPWANESTCALAKKLWEDHSSGEIAKILSANLGITVKRNAVIGYLHRQKLTVANKTEVHPLTTRAFAPRPKYSKPGPKPKPKTERITSALRPRVTHESPEVKAMRCAEVVPLNIGLEALNETTCKWPYGDGPWTFCGNGALKGLPYCQPHQALATKPTRGAA